MSTEKNQDNFFTEQELKEWGEDVIHSKVVELKDPKEIEEAKLLSQEVTPKEFEEL